MLGDGNGAGSDVGNLSLGEMLKQKGEPQLVLAGDTVRTAGKAIARGRKAVSSTLSQPILEPQLGAVKVTRENRARGSKSSLPPPPPPQVDNASLWAV